MYFPPRPMLMSTAGMNPARRIYGERHQKKTFPKWPLPNQRQIRILSMPSSTLVLYTLNPRRQLGLHKEGLSHMFMYLGERVQGFLRAHQRDVEPRLMSASEREDGVFQTMLRRRMSPDTLLRIWTPSDRRCAGGIVSPGITPLRLMTSLSVHPG